MAADREPSEKLDDRQLEQLLKTGLNAPPLTEEYSARLLTRLDHEFRRQAELGAASYASTTIDPDAIKEDELPFSALTRSRAKPRRTKLRLVGLLSVAASLLVALSLWSSGISYSWAAMLKALQETAWVQAVASSGEARGWISSDRHVVVTVSEDQIAFRDNRQQQLYSYRFGEDVLYQQPLADQRGWGWAQELLALLIPPEPGAAVNQNDARAEIEVLSESWNQVEKDSSQVELEIDLKIAADRVVHLVFVLDAETHLPVSCQVVGDGVKAGAKYDFLYPKDGPQSIYALGVPRDVELVARLDRTPLQAAVVTPSPSKDDADQLAVVEPGRAIVADEIIKLDPTKSMSEASGKSTETHDAALDRNIFSTLPAIEPLPEPLAPDELVKKINSQLSAYWQAQGIHPVGPASDEEFLRRIYLDLTGRIPLVNEVYEFLEDHSGARRENLVDDLLQRRDHATHLATVWRTMLLPDGVDLNVYGGTSKFDEWLADRFGANIPYSQLVSELLLAEGRVVESGPILFYAALKLNPEELAAKTSRAFLGLRMECAQCHDHKFDDSISQHDFWSFAAYFAQISRPKGKMETTASVLRVRDNSRGEVMIPDFEEVVPPRLPQFDFAVPTTTPDDASRRRQLVDWLTSLHNQRFARATVNRVWEHLFGRGLVMPIDDMRPDNEPVCPELLETLSREFATSGHDLRKLLRALVLSDAYQLSSRAATDEPSQALAFARMNIKSFSADQLYDCIAVATQNESMLTGNGADGTLQRFGNQSRQAFIEQFRAPSGQRTDYHAGIPQALALMHGGLVHGATDLASSGLLKSLEAPFFEDEQRVETLFLATFSRFPQKEELARMLAHLSAATNKAERQKALGDVLWALLNSAEFTFIH
ncbi:MAG: DUF1549 and DUF1553 domain-containing protein [Pirellulales bacterium]|nr:DUF1549 and DUF1553 domain-containing protein [Pirellulales bacterium]